MGGGLFEAPLCDIMCSSVDKEDVTMLVNINSYREDGKRLASFQGEVASSGLGLLVRGALSVRGVSWVSVTVGKHAEKHYEVETDFSWRRVW